MVRLTVENLEGNVLRELEVRTGTLTLGRGADCDIKLASASVSRQHARLRVDEDGAIVEDLGSSNGVLVDGRHITGPTRVHAGTAAIGEFIVRITPADPTFPHAETIDATDPAAVQHPDPGPQGQTLQLVRFGDDHEGERLTLMGDDTTLGRVSRCDLQVVHPSVSRRHARIVRRGEQYILVDEGSSNGTRVNSTIVTQPTVLREGDVVQVGDVWFAIAGATQPVDTGRLTTRWVHEQEPPTRTNRGLLVLITTMTVIVLVLGVVLLVLQTRIEPEPEPTTSSEPSVDPAAALLAQGRGLAEAEDWAAALDRLEAAAAAAPEPSDELSALLATVRREAEADTTWTACSRLLDDAQQLEAAGSTQPAIDAYQAVRTCIADLPDDTRTAERAEQIVAETVVPTIMRLYRYDGAVALQQRRYPAAVEALTAATVVAEDSGTQAPEGIETELRSALVLLGDQAFGEDDWRTALDAYDRAEAIAPLDDAPAARRSRARQNLGLAP